MDKRLKIIIGIFLTALVILGIVILALNSDKNNAQPDPGTPTSTPTPTVSLTPSPDVQTPAASTTPEPTPTPAVIETPEPSAEPDLSIRTDYENYKPNESGEIPVIMFHRFLEAYAPDTEKDYTTTLGEFEALLQTLYDEGYRLISMKDFIECNITVPAGYRPMVFTFDDGSAGQFNLIEENGRLVLNPKTAVGVMAAFNEKHPDFGLKGIFYVNMDIGDNTFKGAGSLKERFEYLQSLGFEIGNHTWGHVDYKKLTTAGAIVESLGKNQKKALEVMPELNFYSLALPYGSLPKDSSLKQYLVKGEYEGISYENLSIMAVGANPSVPSIHVDYNAQYVRRIRAQGRVAVDGDLTWWLPRMTEGRMYISDGDPTTIVVPESKAQKVNEQLLNGKTLITY